MESILSGDNDVDVQDLMLQACEHEDSAGCAIVRISLDEQVDEQTYEFLQNATSRILPSLQLVRQTRAMDYGSCGNKTVSSKLGKRLLNGSVVVCTVDLVQKSLMDELNRLMVSMQSAAERWIASDRIWWKEHYRRTIANCRWNNDVLLGRSHRFRIGNIC